MTLFGDIVEKVCCHPAYRLLSLRALPQMPPASLDFTTFTWPAILRRLRQMQITGADFPAVHTHLLGLLLVAAAVAILLLLFYAVVAAYSWATLSGCLLQSLSSTHDCDSYVCDNFGLTCCSHRSVDPEDESLCCCHPSLIRNYRQGLTSLSYRLTFLCCELGCRQRSGRRVAVEREGEQFR